MRTVIELSDKRGFEINEKESSNMFTGDAENNRFRIQLKPKEKE